MTREFQNIPHISVAPMMDWTNRHCRFFHRLISPHTRLYTEMVTTGALIHGDAKRFLRYNQSEHPLALQLGGSDPDDLARCARLGENAGYDEINLNCGCPSDRVQSGCFGAVLMNTPSHVATCIASMQSAVSIPVTIKCRIAVDDAPEEKFLYDFIACLTHESPCTTFIIHARKAWLKGLSPKENRDIPPLNYELVAKIKSLFPKTSIIINGGITQTQDIQEHLNTFDGVMIGRAAYQNPWLLNDIEKKVFNNENLACKYEIITKMAKYASREYQRHGTPVKSVTKHMIGLFQGEPGARAWRQKLSPLRFEDYDCTQGDGDVLLHIYDSIWGNNHNNTFTDTSIETT